MGRCSQVWEVTLSRWDGCMSLDLHYEGCSLVIYRGVTCSDWCNNIQTTTKLRSSFYSQAKNLKVFNILNNDSLCFFLSRCLSLAVFVATKTAKAQLGMFVSRNLPLKNLGCSTFWQRSPILEAMSVPILLSAVRSLEKKTTSSLGNACRRHDSKSFYMLHSLKVT